jgi:plastocyanin
VSPAVVSRALAHATGDPSVAIADFRFTPGAITVHVGDTITWTNSGPSPHTATANGGSFDTGTLQKGQSASHTFTQAGTFSYFCTIHPFMKGTVVVLASASTTQPSSGSGGSSKAGASTPSGTTTSRGAHTSTSPGAASSAASSTSSGANASSNLPHTGLSLLAVLFWGLVLVVSGSLLRRETWRTRRPRQ